MIYGFEDKLKIGISNGCHTFSGITNCTTKEVESLMRKMIGGKVYKLDNKTKVGEIIHLSVEHGITDYNKAATFDSRYIPRPKLMIYF